MIADGAELKRQTAPQYCVLSCAVLICATVAGPAECVGSRRLATAADCNAELPGRDRGVSPL